jgi:cytoskeletal protein CcmA (bactofilin family)
MDGTKLDETDSLHTIVGAKSVFRGDVEFTGSMRVEGSVIGSVTGVIGNASRFWLDEAGIILGNVYVTDAVIDGRITGNVHCTGYLELGASASIQGDVHYAYLEMHLGATVNGLLVRETAVPSEGKVAPLKSILQVQPLSNATDSDQQSSTAS